MFSQETKDRALRWSTIALIGITVIGGTLMAIPNYRRGRRLQLQEAELKLRIEKKKAQIAELAENQRRFRTDPDFVERIARQNRRVYPGELVFLFED